MLLVLVISKLLLSWSLQLTVNSTVNVKYYFAFLLQEMLDGAIFSFNKFLTFYLIPGSFVIKGLTCVSLGE